MPDDPRRPSLRYAGAWVLAPLVAGVVYAVASPALRARPSLRDLVPRDAVETQRFKDLAAFDAARPPPRGLPASSALLGAALNLRGLPGIDRTRPLLGMTLAPRAGPASELYVLPVSDAGLVRRRFDDPDLEERRAVRLEVHGDLAAIGRDRAAVRRAVPAGGVWPEERGEDWARAADWPRLVDHVAERGREEPFRSVLQALGVDVDRAIPRPGTAPAETVSWGRLPVVRDAWATVSLHGWADRVRADLVPARGGDLARALAEARAKVPGDAPLLPPPHAVGPAVAVHGGPARRALALALRDAGVGFPPSVTLETLVGAPGGSLSLWAQESAGAGGSGAWTLVLAGRDPPDVSAFGLPAADDEPVPYAAGIAALTSPFRGEALAGAVVRRALGPSGDVLVAVGPDAASVAENAEAALREGARAPVPEGPPGTRVLATLRLPAEAARRLLGPALGPGGLLFPLSPVDGGALEGVVSTDGERLVLEVRRRP